MILPVIGGMSEFRTIAVIALYALSILARYMPGAWRRVEGGDWDEHRSINPDDSVDLTRLSLPTSTQRCGVLDGSWTVRNSIGRFFLRRYKCRLPKPQVLVGPEQIVEKPRDPQAKNPGLDFSKRGFSLSGVQSGAKLDVRIGVNLVGKDYAVDEQRVGLLQSKAGLQQGLDVQLVKLVGSAE